MRFRLVLALLSTLTFGTASCKTPQGDGRERAVAKATLERRACPRELAAPPILPFARPVHSVPYFWLARLVADRPADAALLDRAAIDAHNARVRALRYEKWPAGRWNLLERKLDQAALSARFAGNIKKLREAIAKGKRMHVDGRRPWDVAKAVEALITQSEPVDELRLAHRGAPIRCYPTSVGLYDEPWSKSFDLMQCARLRLGEAVRVLRRVGGWVYVWTDYTEGWVNPAALTPALDVKRARAYLEPEHTVVVTRDRQPLLDKSGAMIGVARLGARLPLIKREGDRLHVSVPTARGLVAAQLERGVGARVGYLPLSRRALFEAAFAHLDAPYGWGGSGGHRDCSRLLMDLFDTFGLHMPRNSWMQSRAGMASVDVSKLDDAAKARAIEAASRRGLVLLYLPGHIMMYVGREGQQLYALHQFSGYLVPCSEAAKRVRGGRGDGKDGKAETMYRVNRTAVTSLELGRGGSRRAFIERITKLVIIGPADAATSASGSKPQPAPETKIKANGKR